MEQRTEWERVTENWAVNQSFHTGSLSSSMLSLHPATLWQQKLSYFLNLRCVINCRLHQLPFSLSLLFFFLLHIFHLSLLLCLICGDKTNIWRCGLEPILVFSFLLTLCWLFEPVFWRLFLSGMTSKYKQMFSALQTLPCSQSRAWHVCILSVGLFDPCCITSQPLRFPFGFGVSLK